MRRRTVLALLATLLAGCHTRSPEPLAPMGAARIDAGHLTFHAVLRHGPRTRRFRLAVALRRPGRFRLELSAAVGGPRVVVACDGEQLQAAIPPQRVLARAAAGPEQMAVLVGLPVGPDGLLALLTGSPQGSDSAVQWEHGRDGVPAAARVGSPEQEAYHVSYSEVGPGPWGLQARQLDIVRGEVRLTLRLKSASRKQPLPEAFRLPPLPRFEEVDLHRLAGLGETLFPEDP